MVGTVTAFSFRKACFNNCQSVSWENKARADCGPYHEGPPPARSTKGPPDHAHAEVDSSAGSGKWQAKEPSTHLGNAALGQVIVPAVLNLFNLAVAADIDLDLGVHYLLLLDALDHILIGQFKLDGVAAREDLVTLDLNGAEDGRETVPLRRELVVALGDGDVVCKGCGLGPQ